MAQVTVTIAGRVYRMACTDGEQPHIESLARIVDAKIESLRTSFGEIGDQRITVMAALTFADELSEAKRRIAELEIDNYNTKNLDDMNKSKVDTLKYDTAAMLGSVTKRIEALTHELNSVRN